MRKLSFLKILIKVFFYKFIAVFFSYVYSVSQFFEITDRLICLVCSVIWQYIVESLYINVLTESGVYAKIYLTNV